MPHYEVYLSPYQEDGFLVKANNIDEGVRKVVTHAKKKHPGFFDEDGNIIENGYPLVMEIIAWQ